MKFRRDFVTNSSSSSFICDYCGYDITGYDISPMDYDMLECGAGHYICKSHMPTDYELDEYGYLDEKDCPFCNFTYIPATKIYRLINAVYAGNKDEWIGKVMPHELCTLERKVGIFADDLRKAYRDDGLTVKDLEDDIANNNMRYPQFKKEMG